MERKDQIDCRLERAGGMLIHELPPQRGRALPVGGRVGSQRICEAEAEQHLVALASVGAGAQIIFVSSGGLIISACGERAVRHFELDYGGRGSRRRGSRHSGVFLACRAGKNGPDNHQR